MREAIAWLEEDGQVSIYCEAIPETPSESLTPRMAHRKRRGFTVVCGDGKIHVTAILAATLTGPCKNLGEDLKCRIYERRPLVCQIYPAEISPFVELDPKKKACPPEAWPMAEPDKNPFLQYLPSLAEKSRQTDYNEASRKGLVCDELGIDASGLADEGYVRHFPESGAFLAALKKAVQAAPETSVNGQRWRLFSRTLAAQPRESHGLDVITEKPAEAGYQYLRA
jgi:Fe-S-cluster containining protein